MRRLLPLLICLSPAIAWGQVSPPLPAYVPPTSSSPLPPLPDADAPDTPGDLGDVRASSNDAANISAADTRSPIAPRLPDPATGGDSAHAYLAAARAAISADQTGAAQEALERAESRLLDRDVAPADAANPATDTAIRQIDAARAALSVGNGPAALAAIAAADTAAS